MTLGINIGKRLNEFATKTIQDVDIAALDYTSLSSKLEICKIDFCSRLFSDSFLFEEAVIKFQIKSKGLTSAMLMTFSINFSTDDIICTDSADMHWNHPFYVLNNSAVMLDDHIFLKVTRNKSNIHIDG